MVHGESGQLWLAQLGLGYPRCKGCCSDSHWVQATVKHRYGPQVPVHFSISFSGSSELRVLCCKIT